LCSQSHFLHPTLKYQGYQETDVAGLIRKLLPKRFRKQGVTIPVVRLHGAIMAGGSAFRPMLNLATVGPLLDKAFADKEAPAVAIAINSPGGSPVQSRLIYQRIRDLADEKHKRVIVFVEDVAASGGYMIALAGDEIIADPTSIVGSIGVVSGGFGFTELIHKIGVERRVYTAGENKVMLDPFQPEKEKDVAYLKGLQQEIHGVFTAMVKARRGHLLAADGEIFSGLFWTGERARALGLVDGLGNMRGELKRRYGEKTELRLVSAGRGLLGRRQPGVGLSGSLASGAVAEMAASAVAGLAEVAEERALWGRFGL
jgi:signal peptide peptidase SppA